MADPTFRAKTSVAGAARAGVTLTVPTGVVAGDLLVAHCAYYPSSATGIVDATPPTGWTLKHSVLHSTAVEYLATWYKRADSSDQSGAGTLTYTFGYADGGGNPTTNAAYCLGDMIAFANPAASGDPWDFFTYVGPASETSTTTNYPATSGTTTHNGALLWWVGFSGDGTTTVPSGFTLRSTEPGGGVSFGGKTQTTAGATGSITATCSTAAYPSAVLSQLAATGGAALSVSVAASPTSILTTGTSTVTATATGGSGTKTYAWTKTSGPAASFASTTAASTTFTPTGGAGTYVLRCTVTDGSGSAYGEVTVTVSTPSNYVTFTSIDVSTNWTATGGTTLAVVTDSSGATYVTSSNNPAAQEFTGTLAALTAPTAGNPLTVLVDIDRVGGTTGSFTAKLLEGTTVRSTVSGLTLPVGTAGTDVTGQVTVNFPSTDIAAVTNWSALKVQLLVTAS